MRCRDKDAPIPDVKLLIQLRGMEAIVQHAQDASVMHPIESLNDKNYGQVNHKACEHEFMRVEVIDDPKPGASEISQHVDLQIK